jgi:hypothetical protein
VEDRENGANLSSLATWIGQTYLHSLQRLSWNVKKESPYKLWQAQPFLCGGHWPSPGTQVARNFFSRRHAIAHELGCPWSNRRGDDDNGAVVRVGG